ncbi:MAG: hypothetical protein IJC75_05700 [Oscillospiraceae bacterium]|nr:hypothetical protein [Ruminococcus sp.]MBQ4346615.1 hypothetical protein [Oscillospiraceae bacterium]
MMQYKALAKGVALGVTAGTVGYFLSRATTGEKNRLKRRTVKAVQAVGAVWDSVSELLHM